jgi:hypothetical protein
MKTRVRFIKMLGIKKFEIFNDHHWRGKDVNAVCNKEREAVNEVEVNS